MDMQVPDWDVAIGGDACPRRTGATRGPLWLWAWSAPLAAVVLPSIGGLLGLIVVGIAERATGRWPGETAMYLAYSLRHLGLAAAFGWALLVFHVVRDSGRWERIWRLSPVVQVGGQHRCPRDVPDRGQTVLAAHRSAAWIPAIVGAVSRCARRAGMRQSTFDLLWIGGSMVLAIVVALLWPAGLDLRRAYEDEWILVPVFSLPTVCVVGSAIGLTLCGARSMRSGEYLVAAAKPSCQGTSHSSGMAPSAGSDGDHNSAAAQKSRGPVAATGGGWSGVALVVAGLGLVAVGPLAGLAAGWGWLGAVKSSEAMFVAVLVLGHSLPMGSTILLCLAAWWRASEVEVQRELPRVGQRHQFMHPAPFPETVARSSEPAREGRSESRPASFRGNHQQQVGTRGRARPYNGKQQVHDSRGRPSRASLPACAGAQCTNGFGGCGSGVGLERAR